VIKSLGAGVPVLAMPMGRDQLDNAARVVHHGAGLRLGPRARPAKIAAAVRRLLVEPGFADGARRQAEAIAARPARTARPTRSKSWPACGPTGGRGVKEGIARSARRSLRTARRETMVPGALPVGERPAT
jgi:acetylornithine/succinyldiaminopimelate/putrescine aminotransferase